MSDSQLETAGTALLLVALVAVPTASQDVEYPDKRISDTPVISEKTTTKTEININPSEASTAKGEKHDTIYKVQETPSKRIEVLETPQATLKVKRTNKTRIFKLTTPYGDITKGLKDGRRVESFEGLNRTRANNVLQNLKRRTEIYSEKVRDKILPDVTARITRDKADDPDERITIDNDEGKSVDLNGWTLINSEGDRYTFEDLEIPAYGNAYVYTAEESSLNVSESESQKYVYNTGVDWDQGKDEASVFNVNGVEVAEDSYS